LADLLADVKLAEMVWIGRLCGVLTYWNIRKFSAFLPTMADLMAGYMPSNDRLGPIANRHFDSDIDLKPGLSAPLSSERPAHRREVRLASVFECFDFHCKGEGSWGTPVE
jgi:hypothetical protein